MALASIVRLRTCALAGVLALGAASCNSTKQSVSIDNVDSLIGRVERVHLEAELSKQAVYDALLKMQPMFARNFEGDPAEAFQSFVDAAYKSLEQAEVFRDQVDPMTKDADTVFRRWSESLLEFNSPTLRARSAKRLEATRERFAEVQEAAQTALADYNGLNEGLEDMLLFLGNDFNEAAIEEIAPDAIDVRDEARSLSVVFDDCMDIAAEYVSQSALRGQTVTRSGEAVEIQVESETGNDTELGTDG